jgi:hypothetical protein
VRVERVDPAGVPEPCDRSTRGDGRAPPAPTSKRRAFPVVTRLPLDGSAAYPVPMPPWAHISMSSVVSLVFIGCGSGPAAAGGDAAPAPDANLPSIDPDADTTTLTNMQLGELCDWAVGELGGYGTTIKCVDNGGGPMSVDNPQNQAMCIATAFKFFCSVTVGQYEGCVEEQAPSHGCKFPLVPPCGCK